MMIKIGESTMTEIQFRVNKLSRVYGKKNPFWALREVSLDINAGEMIAIIGKSGSGKSTLMHLLATLDRPTSGSITLEDQDLGSLNSSALSAVRNQTFGFIFQQFFLNPKESVIDNVALPLKIAGVNKRERQSRAVETLAVLDLQDKANMQAKDLSGGQMQRVCIARALVTNPKIIFADEPTGNLDSENGQIVIDLLRSLCKEKGITVIMVTHDADIAASCDRQIRLKDGRLEIAK
jgi:putative ABC transport system ATP-binding protein